MSRQEREVAVTKEVTVCDGCDATLAYPEQWAQGNDFDLCPACQRRVKAGLLRPEKETP